MIRKRVNPGNATYEYVVPLVIFFIATGVLLSIGELNSVIPQSLANTMNADISGGGGMAVRPLGPQLTTDAGGSGQYCFGNGQCIQSSATPGAGGVGQNGIVDTTGANGAEEWRRALTSRAFLQELRSLEPAERRELMSLIQALAEEGHGVADVIGDLNGKRDRLDNISRRLWREQRKLAEVGDKRTIERQLNQLNQQMQALRYSDPAAVEALRTRMDVLRERYNQAGDPNVIEDIRNFRQSLYQEINSSETEIAQLDIRYQQLKRQVEVQLRRQGLNQVEQVIDQESAVITQNAQQAVEGNGGSESETHQSANVICDAGDGDDCRRDG